MATLPSQIAWQTLVRGLRASYFVYLGRQAGRINGSQRRCQVALVAHADAALHWRRTLCLVSLVPGSPNPSTELLILTLPTVHT